MKRRVFVKSLVALAATCYFPTMSTAKPKSKTRRLKIKEGMTILFQGDSITDAMRKREANRSGHNNPYGYGYGYMFIAASEVLRRHPEAGLKIYNRGISGNKVCQLQERWEKDCFALKPDVLSILIGINDHWHTTTGRFEGSPERYEREYRALLRETRERLPEVKLVIGEPFILDGSAVKADWYPVVAEYRAIARRLAEEFGAIFIPYQQLFDEALKQAPASYWLRDGVHPTAAGAQLMADAWLDHVFGY